MKRSDFFLLLCILSGVLFFSLVAADYSWVGYDINYTAVEDTAYHHNLTNNVTGDGANRVFSINDTAGIEILWNEGVVTLSQISSWIYIANETTGDLVINATADNETGRFRLPITVAWGGASASTVSFYFNVTAVNDAPTFLNLENKTFNSTQLFEYLVNAADEENNYPFVFNISFLNCTTAEWSTRNNTNCTLFNLSQYSANSTSINISFTPGRNDVGNYVINFTVRDYNNASTSKIANFSVFNVNLAPYFRYVCDDERSTSEYSNFTCRVNASDIDETSNLTISANYSWFKFNGSNSITTRCNLSTDYNVSALVNFTADDLQVGNWSVNISVTDNNLGVNSSVFWFYVENVNDSVSLGSIANVTAYTSNNYTIYVNATDNDLLIPDKSVYNEILAFSSNHSSVSVSASSTSGNITTAIIQFNPNNFISGNHSINITVRDANNYSVDSRVFVISIFSNTAPVWNSSLATNYSLTEEISFYLNLTANVSDSDGDNITFLFSNDTSFPSFLLNTTTGIINFTPDDSDVGQHFLIINASDSISQTPLTFNFTVLNINDIPVIVTPLPSSSGNNITVNETNSNMNTTEDNPSKILLYVQDNDFKIPDLQKGFYNETLNLNLIIVGRNTSLFNFTKISNFPLASQNESRYAASFIPRKNDVGSYNITVNVSDLSGNFSNIVNFNITILAVEHSPVLMTLENKTSKVNSSFYYRINATDTEDGGSANSFNFTFSYLNLTSQYLFNSTTFNSTTGEINITFNSTQEGKHSLNITVSDLSGRNDSKDFWIYVYGYPSINQPVSSKNFYLKENATSNLTFQSNHTVGDNLTYYFYVDNALKYNLSYYGNNTNITWQFLPNYTDETYGVKNITLILGNPTYPEINYSSSWNITINHTNSPVTLTEYSINDKESSYSSQISINLGTYFSDADYSDVYYNQTVNFTIASNTSSTKISSSLSGWTLTLSATTSTIERLIITASDLNDTNSTMTNVPSNTFEIKFTSPSTTAVPSSGGGGGFTKVEHYSLKILSPEDIVVSDRNYIEILITIKNTGQVNLRGITLSGIVSFNNLLSDEVKISLAQTYISELPYGASKNLTMKINADTQKMGRYKATIYANVTSPKFSDWGDVYIELRRTNETEAEDALIFTGKLVTENQECLELTEIVKEAKKLFDEKRFTESVKKSREAVEACESAISRGKSLKSTKMSVPSILLYVGLGTLFVFLIWIIVYIYKKVKFNKDKLDGYV